MIVKIHDDFETCERIIEIIIGEEEFSDLAELQRDAIQAFKIIAEDLQRCPTEVNA